MKNLEVETRTSTVVGRENLSRWGRVAAHWQWRRWDAPRGSGTPMRVTLVSIDIHPLDAGNLCQRPEQMRPGRAADSNIWDSALAKDAIGGPNHGVIWWP